MITKSEIDLLASALIGNGRPLSGVQIDLSSNPFVASCLVDYSGGNIRKEEIYFRLFVAPSKSEYFDKITRLCFVGSVSSRAK